MNKLNKLKLWKKFYKRNIYYHKNIQKFALHLIPPDASVVEFSARRGELLAKLPNKNKTGVEFYEDFSKFSGLKKVNVFTDRIFWKKYKKVKFDYILINNTFSDVEDIQDFINKIKKLSKDDTRIIVFFFNFLWKPLLDITETLGLRMPYLKEPNWLSAEDIDNLFYTESFEKIKSGKKILIPLEIPLLSELINKYISVLPIVNNLSLMDYAVYKPVALRNHKSVSIIIPARNEEGNMKGILKKIPDIGTKTEVIFVEGHSKDETYNVISKEIEYYKGNLKVSLYKQEGKGKGDAVRLGFSKAKNELLMILDADLTVDPKELQKFYRAIVEGKGDLVMGSRLIYPMETQAMRTLNILGNKFFSAAFSFLLDQRIKDTLCGTKVLLKTDYERILINRKYFGDFDPFGDFDLIFGASKLNLKIVEIPIRYKERSYGKTNISRFSHGLLLMQMLLFAVRKIKFS